MPNSCGFPSGGSATHCCVEKIAKAPACLRAGIDCQMSVTTSSPDTRMTEKPAVWQTIRKSQSPKWNWLDRDRGAGDSAVAGAVGFMGKINSAKGFWASVEASARRVQSTTSGLRLDARPKSRENLFNFLQLRIDLLDQFLRQGSVVQFLGQFLAIVGRPSQKIDESLLLRRSH